MLAIDAETHAELKRQLEHCEAAGERMMAQIARLRAALQPFANKARFPDAPTSTYLVSVRLPAKFFAEAKNALDDSK